MDMLTLVMARKYTEKLKSETDADIALLKEVVITGEIEDLVICESGSITLNNSLVFPFNNSQTTIALSNTQLDTDYAVIAEVGNQGNVGDITVFDKQVNGFKMAYTGSAASVTINYYVLGGLFV